MPLEQTILKTVEAFWRANWFIPTKWENVALDTDNLDEWSALTVKPVSSKRITLMGPPPEGTRWDRGSRRSYLVFVQIFNRVGVGTGRLRTLAETAKNLLSEKTLALYDGTGGFLSFTMGEVFDIGETGNGWYQFNVQIPFQYDVHGTES